MKHLKRIARVGFLLASLIISSTNALAASDDVYDTNSSQMPQHSILTKSSEGDGHVGDYAYVDFGLPSGTLWATCNIGSESPEEYGDYFAWEENNSWGEYWTMPTLEQFQELRKYCANKWVEENGVSGLRIFNDSKSIFLPATGIKDDSDKAAVMEAGKLGLYWSSTQVPSEDDSQSADLKAYALEFAEGSVSFSSSFEKCYGLPIRPVTSISAVAGVNSNNINKITVSVTDGKILVNGCTPSDTVEVMDISGALLRSCTAGSTKVVLEVGSKGVYVVRVNGKNDVKHVVKLII